MNLLSGCLSHFSVSDVLNLIATTRESGVLELWNDDARFGVYLSGGQICGFSTAKSGEDLEEIVRRRFNPYLIDMAEKTHNGPEDLISILLETGTVMPNEIARLVEETVFDSLHQALRWDNGHFRFYRGHDLPSWTRGIRLDVQRLLLRAADTCTSWADLPEAYRSPTTSFRLCADPKTSSISLSMDDWTVLYRVTAGRSLSDIWSGASGDKDLAISRLLFGLVSAGLLRIVEPGNEEVATGFVDLPDLEWTRETETNDFLEQEITTRLLSREFRALHHSSSVVREGDSSQLIPAAMVRVESTAQLVSLDSDEDFEVASDNVRIGRTPGNDIVLRDRRISRHHARLTRQGNLFVIEDLGSRNGVFVDGLRIRRARLTGGEVIHLLPFRFCFEVVHQVSARTPADDDHATTRFPGGAGSSDPQERPLPA